MALVCQSARFSQASPLAKLPLEIRDHVAELLPNRDRVALAQVDREWTEIAERHIWRDLPSIPLLLLCLPSDAWCVNRVVMARICSRLSRHQLILTSFFSVSAYYYQGPAR